MRLDYVELRPNNANNPEAVMTLDFYNTEDQERLIKIEKDVRCVEKIINCLQMSDPWMQSYTLQNSMSIKKSIMGRKVIIDRKVVVREEMEQKHCDEFVKSLVISKRIHKVAKEDSTNSVIHLIVSIENLGKCYITIEFITSLRNIQGEIVTLISIDVLPVEARLKLLKVIMNENDIRTLYKNKLSEILNDRARLLQLFQRVVSSLVLLRTFHYATLSVPLSFIDKSSNKHVEDIKEYYINTFNKFKLSEHTGFELNPFMTKLFKESWVLHKRILKVQFF